MKSFSCIFTLLCIILTSKGQDASKIYNNSVNSTITIETDISLGSGFYISENIICTNYHVIDGALLALCYSPNSIEEIGIEGCVAIDEKNDLVLLKVKNTNKPSLKISENKIVPGQKVYVIGSPKGLPATISDGIIGGLRDFGERKLIQITAPISSGSSGGPVLNDSGELIGISVGQLPEAQNINFAVPVVYLKNLLLRKDDPALPLSILFDKTGTIRDNRDGSIYKTIRIGSQIWMAENLKLETVGKSWCFDESENNCKIFGKLYTWETAKNSCPIDWHLPSSSEWTTLFNFLGDNDILGSKLKSKQGWSGWGNGSTANGSDESGFNGLPGGFRTYDGTSVGLVPNCIY